MGGEQYAKDSNISSSGVVQLPPLDMKDPMLSQDETDESENPEDEVGLLDVALNALRSISDQSCGPS